MMDSAVTFRLFPWRFHFAATQPVQFPPIQAANTFRGALGQILREQACSTSCPGPRACPVRNTCAYAQIFEPQPGVPGPSGLTNPPRPFVLRASHLDGRRLSVGDPFYLDLHMFDIRRPARKEFVAAFSEIARRGFGYGRQTATLQSICQLDAAGCETAPAEAPLELSLIPVRQHCGRVAVHFVTPTELKVDGTVADRPEFSVLFARLRDRISAIGALYGDKPLSIDFQAMGQAAADVHMTGCNLRHIAAERRSTRTGQVHAIGGFIGTAEYQGELANFVPYLRAGWWTGVGRQTVWGKGAIRIDLPEDSPAI